MNDNQQTYTDESSENSKEDELPIAELQQENKIKIIKSMVLLLIFSSSIWFSLIYCNTPTFSANIWFANHKNQMNYLNFYNKLPVYIVNSQKKYSNQRYINVSLLNTTYLNETASEVYFRIILLQNKVRVTVSSNPDMIYKTLNTTNIPWEWFDNNDIDCNIENPIDITEQCKINLHVNTYPFSFRFYRVDNNETLFNTMIPVDDIIKDNIFIYSDKVIQISSKLNEEYKLYFVDSNNQRKMFRNGRFDFSGNYTIRVNNEGSLENANYVLKSSTGILSGGYMFSEGNMKITVDEKMKVMTYILDNTEGFDFVINDNEKII